MVYGLATKVFVVKFSPPWFMGNGLRARVKVRFKNRNLGFRV
jgi:hypothetical protein